MKTNRGPIGPSPLLIPDFKNRHGFIVVIIVIEAQISLRETTSAARAIKVDQTHCQCRK